MCWESPFHNCVASSWRAIGDHVRIHCTSESHKSYVRSLLLQVNSRSQVNFIHVQNSVLGRRPAHLLVFKTLHRTSFARYIYSHDCMRVAHNILRSQGDLHSFFSIKGALLNHRTSLCVCCTAQTSWTWILGQCWRDKCSSKPVPCDHFCDHLLDTLDRTTFWSHLFAINCERGWTESSVVKTGTRQLFVSFQPNPAGNGLFGR